MRTIVWKWFAVWALVPCACLPDASVSSLWADEPVFRPVAINVHSEYSACAVFDVNRDGKPDIFAGGFWYEGPDWKRHFVREVEQIGGRFDDYSNLPVDVDGDGWVDVVSCNYRSRSIYWVRNPGTDDVPWTKHVVAKPGRMETGRLADLDGDGTLDLLPNGTDFAAWWSLPRSAEEDPLRASSWHRHELPAELAGHGIGWGDVDGDGTVDLVSARGWYSLSQRADERWRPEFRLHQDAGIPILVVDVDGDGDNDVIWGRGHHVGLYWLEQMEAAGRRRWVWHVIDTSWSQAHSLLWADVDGDRQNELIAGQRYLGHDGRDLGEYNPLSAAWYKFDKTRRVWRRSWIQQAGPAGFGLDPKAADIDGDGDIDLVAADRNGLYVFVNEGPHAPRNADAPAERAVDHRRPLVWIEAGGSQTVIRSPAQWGERRARILKDMSAVMGALPGPELRCPLDVQWVAEEETDKYVRHLLRFTAEPGDTVPAYLLVPKELAGRAPAMLCLHQTTRIGKGEPAGMGGLPNLHYAHELAERGFVCLVPDYPSFGDYPFDFQAARERFASGSMKAIWNNMRAVDLLESLPQVDPDRIGVIGHSLGGHNALFTAAWDMRLRAVVTSCGFTAFHHYYGGKLAGWTSDRYMPRIRDEFGNDPDRVPFDFYEVLAAIAPRAIFVCAPLHDSNFDVQGVRKVEASVREVARVVGGEDRLRFIYPDCAHDFPPEARQEAYAWLEKELGKK